MYAIIPQQIPQGKRAEINEKILFAINSGKDMIPAESIYNCYTGIGGLHNLKQSDFASYHEYAEAKKEFEMGQFFTPHEVCRDMVDVLSPTSSEMILDMCCGMGNFFNHLPNQHNAYGFDIDSKAVAVARYLYPDAHIEKCDIQQYHSEQRFDAIIGNPPFNLKFDFKLSQEYYIDKSYLLLNPAKVKKALTEKGYTVYGRFPNRKYRDGKEQVSYEDFFQELENSCCGANLLTYIGLVNLKDLYDADFRIKEVIIPKGNTCGLFSSMYGGGSLIEMELQNDVRIRLDKARKDGYGLRLRLDNERSEYDCSIKHVYGVCDTFFGKQVSIVSAN